MLCVCDLPATGGRAYDCSRLGCRMTPHFCNLYQTDSDYREAWDNGEGPSHSLSSHREAQQATAPAGGPGTELKNLLRKFGIHPKGCACNRIAAEMDRRGVEWCRANVDKIASRMYEEARKRKFPLAKWSRPAIKQLIRWAIRRSERRH